MIPVLAWLFVLLTASVSAPTDAAFVPSARLRFHRAAENHVAHNTTLFAAPHKAFRLAGRSEEDLEKCAEECSKGYNSEGCMAEKCPQAYFCSSYIYNYPCACDIFPKGEYRDLCEDEDIEIAYTKYCTDDATRCDDDFEKAFEEKEEKCTQECYDEDTDDIVSAWQKCAKRCASQFEIMNDIKKCDDICVGYNDCPKSSQSKFEEYVEKSGKEGCEKYKNDEVKKKSCISYWEDFAENLGSVICPKVQAWVIILIVVLVVVVAACVVVGIFLFLKFRGKSGEAKQGPQQ